MYGCSYKVSQKVPHSQILCPLLRLSPYNPMFLGGRSKVFTRLPPLFFLHKKKSFWQKSHFAVGITPPFLSLQQSI